MLSVLRFIFMAVWSAFLMLITPFLIPLFFKREIPLIVGRVLFAPVLLAVAGIKLTKQGVENVPLDRPIIFVSNHCSHFDIACLFATLPRNIYFVAKKELLWVPFLGFNLWSTGHILIDRSNRKKSILSLRQAAKKIAGGKCVTLYAEGTRTTTGEIGPFKKGAFHLALDAGVDIVPIHIEGTFKIWPKGSWKIKPGKAHVNVGKPIKTSNYSKQTVNQFVQDTRNAVLALKPKITLDQPLQNQAFFEALANVFYAIAIADKKFELSEKHAIFNEINSNWTYAIDSSKSSELMFEVLRQNIAQNISDEIAFRNFEKYYIDNKELFSVITKTAIMDAVNLIASSFAKKNKSELVMLSRIQLLMTN